MTVFRMRRTVFVLAGLAALGVLFVTAGCAGPAAQTAPASRPQAGQAPAQGRGPGMGGPNREMLFSVMDVDQDGYISAQEFVSFQNRDFTRRDLDADQRLSREEFTAPPRPPAQSPGQAGGQTPGQPQGYPQAAPQ